jgi:hypothetical protein
MEEQWEPFEIIEDVNGRTLNYDSRKLRRKTIVATEVPRIMDAIKLGLNVSGLAQTDSLGNMTAIDGVSPPPLTV